MILLISLASSCNKPFLHIYCICPSSTLGISSFPPTCHDPPCHRTIARAVPSAWSMFLTFFEELILAYPLDCNLSVPSSGSCPWSLWPMPLSKPCAPLLHYACHSCNLTMVCGITWLMHISPASCQSFTQQVHLTLMRVLSPGSCLKEGGREGGRKEGRKEGRKGGRKERRKEGRKEERKEGRR